LEFDIEKPSRGTFGNAHNIPASAAVILSVPQDRRRGRLAQRWMKASIQEDGMTSPTETALTLV